MSAVVQVYVRGARDAKGRRAVSLEIEGRKLSFYDRPGLVLARLQADLPGVQFLLVETNK